MDDIKVIKEEKLNNVNGGWFGTATYQPDLTKTFDGQCTKSDAEKTNADDQNIKETRVGK